PPRGIPIFGSLVSSKSTEHGRPIATSVSSLVITPATRVTVPSSSLQSSNSMIATTYGTAPTNAPTIGCTTTTKLWSTPLPAVSNHPISIDGHLLHAGMFGGNHL